MKQVEFQKKPFSRKTAILIALCVVLVASVAIIGANWGLIFPPEKPLPQETSGKQPADYTWEEFAALNSEEKDAFAESFASTEAFLQWIDSVTPTENNPEITPEFPWENGGKQPEEYTYSEFLALSIEYQDAFANTFVNADAFTSWQRIAIDKDDTLELPWKNGGKQPVEYTWEDFLALTATEKDLFPLAFSNTNDYQQWLDKVNP